MSRVVARLAGALLIGAAAASAAFATVIDGRWTVDASGHREQVQLRLSRSWNRNGSRSTWTNSDDVSRDELRGLPQQGFDGPVSMSIVRDAGTIRLEGRMGGRHGSGRFTFEADPGFSSQVERMGYRDVGDETLIRLAVANVGLSWIREVRELGLRETSLEGLIRLRNNGVTLEFVRAVASAGYDGLDGEDVVRMSNNGVTPQYLRAIAAGKGRRPSVEEVVRFRNNGLEASYVTALTQQFEAEDIIRLHNNAVSADFVRELKAIGYPEASAQDLIRLRNNDVTASFARRARYLHGPVTIEELIKLRINGVE